MLLNISRYKLEIWESVQKNSMIFNWEERFRWWIHYRSSSYHSRRVQSIIHPFRLSLRWTGNSQQFNFASKHTCTCRLYRSRNECRVLGMEMFLLQTLPTTRVLHCTMSVLFECYRRTELCRGRITIQTSQILVLQFPKVRMELQSTTNMPLKVDAVWLSFEWWQLRQQH